VTYTIRHTYPVTDWFAVYRTKVNKNLIVERVVAFADYVFTNFGPEDQDVYVDGVLLDTDGLQHLAINDCPDNFEFLGLWHKDDLAPSLWHKRARLGDEGQYIPEEDEEFWN